MSVIQEFVFTPPAGKELVTLHQWVATLPENERNWFVMSEARQLELRQKVVEVNKLAVVKNAKSADEDGIVPDSYVWDESQIENKHQHNYKEHDDVWLQYWNRYLEETGTKFEIVEKQIPNDD
jgi:hypothetical protein